MASASAAKIGPGAGFSSTTSRHQLSPSSYPAAAARAPIGSRSRVSSHDAVSPPGGASGAASPSAGGASAGGARRHHDGRSMNLSAALLRTAQRAAWYSGE